MNKIIIPEETIIVETNEGQVDDSFYEIVVSSYRRNSGVFIDQLDEIGGKQFKATIAMSIGQAKLLYEALGKIISENEND